MDYKYINQINFPNDLRKFKITDLDNIAEELRLKTIDTVSKTGGHLGGGFRCNRANNSFALYF